MIEVQNLSKRYPTRLAVDDVTFSVREGEIVGFLGPNGAGKTTTMRVLTGFLPPTAGTARVAGHDVVSQSNAARASLGYLPESAATYPEMRVREYLAFRARLEGVPRGLVRGRVQEALDRCLLVRGGRSENREPLEGIPAADGPRGRARPPAAGADPRRADDRARSRADHQDPRDHPRAREEPLRAAVHAHPSRGRSRLRPRPHHRSRTHRGRRHALGAARRSSPARP